MSIQLTGERATKADLLRQQLAALEREERNEILKQREIRNNYISDRVVHLIRFLENDIKTDSKLMDKLYTCQHTGIWDDDYDIEIRLVERSNLE